MPTRAASLALLLLAACAHAPSRTDKARPTSAAPAVADAPPPAKPVEPVPAKATVDFARDVQPILEARCQPCHFPGGKMYDRLPFDRAATIHGLGTKLFTRIKAEDEKAVIERFLAQP